MCAKMGLQQRKGVTKLEITIVVLSLVLAVENAILIPLLVVKYRNHNKTKEELHSHKQSKEFHINQLKNRYKGVEKDYDGKRNSRKM